MSEDAHDSFNSQYMGNWELTRTAVFSSAEVIILFKKGAINKNEIEPLMRLSFESDGKLSRSPRDLLTEPFYTMEDIMSLERLAVDWVAKKSPTYCQPHGNRVTGYINGVWFCYQKCCVSAAIKKSAA